MMRIKIGEGDEADDYGVGFGYQEKRRGRTRKQGGTPHLSVTTTAIVQLPKRFQFADVFGVGPHQTDEDGTLRGVVTIHDDEGDPTLTAEERAKHAFVVEVVQPKGKDEALDRVMLIARTRCHSVADVYDRGRGRRGALRRVLTGFKQLLPDVYLAKGDRRSVLAKQIWAMYFDRTRDGVEFGMRGPFLKTDKKEAVLDPAPLE